MNPLLRKVLSAGGLAALAILILASADPVDSHLVESITAHELKSIVYFLASDEMKGRDTGSETNQITAQYLAHQLDLLDLKPLGPEDSYLQSFKLLRGTLGEGNRLELTGQDPEPGPARIMQDFYPSRLSASGSASGELVFVGYGISAPESSYDDYEGINLTGRIAVMMLGAPNPDDSDSGLDEFSAIEAGRELTKILAAQQHGAAAVVLFSPNRDGSLYRQANHRWPDDPQEGGFVLAYEASQVRIPVIYAARDLIESATGLDSKAVREEIDQKIAPSSRPLPARARLRTAISRTSVEVGNVLGELPGADPVLRHEWVIVSAHFDHVGTSGQLIFNGADDDASGTSGVLEIAEAFARAPARPRRSVLFAFWNAEEQGLLGSRYFVEASPLSTAMIRTVVQLDMIGRDQEVTNPEDSRFSGMRKQSAEENRDSVNVIGYSRSHDLKNLVEGANRSIGLRLLYEMDDNPLNLIRRSDSWPFLARGVPAVFFTTGLHPDYHTPEDRPEKLDYPKMERVTRLAFLTAWDAANSDQPIHLNHLGTTE